MSAAQIYYDRDADPRWLENQTVAIIGYGSQGHAHALNLRESGVSVLVGLPPKSASRRRAQDHGFSVVTVAEASRLADVVMMLAPDTVQASLYRDEVAPNLVAGDTLMFAHGFNVRFGRIPIAEGVDCSMVAPKAPGHRVRELYQDGAGTPALVAVERDASGQALDRALAYACAIGCGRAGILRTTFAEETETDLFGEQAVLCGGVTALVRAAFETLTGAGYQPEVAYFECLHELKLIVDLMYQGGLSYMWHSVSDTAEHGGYTGGEQIVTAEVKGAMVALLDRIRDGSYAESWLAEDHLGRPTFDARRATERDHPIEHVGARLRELMPFLDAKKLDARGDLTNSARSDVDQTSTNSVQ